MSVFVVMRKRTNTEKLAREGNVICAPTVRKLLLIPLILSIIGVILILMRYTEFFNLIQKVVVWEELVELRKGLTVQ
jgi:hypothetical protein